MSVLEYLALFFFVWLPGVLFLQYGRLQKQHLSLFLTFSGAYILGISVFHLLPDVYKNGEEGYGLFIIVGFLAQIILDQFSKGIEHGHMHHAHASKVNFLVSIAFGLGIHAFFEGFPLAGYHQFHLGHNHSHNSLLLGIILHHAPAAIALGLLMKINGYSNTFALLLISLFAALPPLGALVGTSFVIGEGSYRVVMAIVVGAFMHVSTTIIFETESNADHQISYSKLGSILLGLVMSYFLTMH